MDELSQIFKSFFYVGKFLGFFPFYISKGVAKTSPINVIYSFLIIAGYSASSKMQNELMSSAFKNGSMWSKISFQMGTLLLWYFVILTSIGNLLQRRMFSKGLKKMAEFDGKLAKTFNVKIDYKHQRKISNISMILSFVGFFTMVLLSFNISQGFESKAAPLLALPLFLIVIGQAIYVINFALVIFLIKMRIKILNEKIEKNCEVSKN